MIWKLEFQTVFFIFSLTLTYVRHMWTSVIKFISSNLWINKEKKPQLYHISANKYADQSEKERPIQIPQSLY